MIDLKTRIGNLQFDFPVCNASGNWCMTKQELTSMAESEAGAVVFKSMTVEPRKGNLKKRLYFDDELSLNSMGLPNGGVDYYCKAIEDLRGYDKPMIASIAGFSEEEFHLLFEKVNRKPFSAIEVNLSCPNVNGKCIFAYDVKTSLRILERLRNKTTKVFGVKLPPFYERQEIRTMSEGLTRVGVDFATLINSYPLGCVIDVDSETTMINPNLGVGGLGGSVLKPIALGQVILFNHYSKGKMRIIGVGGITSGRDIYEYVLAGASAVQVGTALLQEGPGIFKRLKHELGELLTQKSVRRLRDKIGTVKNEVVL